MKALCAIGLIFCLVSSAFGVLTYCDWRDTSGKYTCILYNAFLTAADDITTDTISHMNGKDNAMVLRVEVAGPATEFILKSSVRATKLSNLEELIVENGTFKPLLADSLSFVDTSTTTLLKLKVLKLSNVQLATLPANVFKCFSNLKTLDLSKNLIASIDAAADVGLVNLDTLILDDNKILQGSSIFSSTIMTALKIFSIAGNGLTSFPSSFPSKATLEKIDLSRNLIPTIPDAFFTGFSALVELNLDQNKIKTLHNDLFSSLTLLKVLNVASNEIQSFEFLRKATKLEHLNIANQNPKIKLLNATMLDENKELKIFNASYNEITEIYNSLFAKNAEKITTLDLRGNRIEKIEGGFVNYVKNLNSTLLSCNKCISKDYYSKPGEREFDVCKSSSIIVSAALILISITAVKLF